MLEQILLENKELAIQLAVYVTSLRLFFKPFCSFWIKYVAPFINVKPTERLIKHPLYKAASYILDWGASIKLPQEKK